MSQPLWYMLCYVNVAISAMELWAVKLESWLALFGGPPAT